MASDFDAVHLNLPAFIRGPAQLAGETELRVWPRLLAEAGGRGADRRVRWDVRGELRDPSHVDPQPWLHVRAIAVLSLTCQRCLQAVDTALEVDRWFRFVADEATAEAQDESAEEDVLVSSADFNLLELVEDELLLALPLVPRHGQCPQSVQLSAQDADFDAVRPNPFDVLRGLKRGQ